MTRVCARRFCRIRNRKCINGLENVVLMESAIPFQPAAGTRNLWRTYRGGPFVPKHFHWNGPFPLALSFQSVEAENVAKLRAACERNFQIRFLPSAAESSCTTRHKEFLSIFFDSQEKTTLILEFGISEIDGCQISSCRWWPHLRRVLLLTRLPTSTTSSPVC